MRGRKLTVDWKHTAEELYAHYKQERNTHIAKRLQALALLQTRHTHPTSRPHRGRLANVHPQVAHLVSHRGTG
jgi:hypothetical protein